MIESIPHNRFFPPWPFRSTAVALLFSVFLGPIGLLYASFWGGVALILLAFIAVCDKLWVAFLLFWVMSTILAVAATNRHNKKLFKQREKLLKE